MTYEEAVVVAVRALRRQAYSDYLTLVDPEAKEAMDVLRGGQLPGIRRTDSRGDLVDGYSERNDF